MKRYILVHKELGVFITTLAGLLICANAEGSISDKAPAFTLFEVARKTEKWDIKIRQEFYKFAVETILVDGEHWATIDACEKAGVNVEEWRKLLETKYHDNL